ncbi:MAG TPA: DUF1330 domain-containing protein, partial [Candidatus Sulfotelmatobacter sp.]|nr:DUF1330 domain-containing protein [Candidatus Sulfotelmatobacter sp.]
EVTDPTAYEEYRRGVLATVTKHGGKFLVRGGAVQRLEGNRDWNRVVVLEFASAAAAKTWYESPEYQPLAKLRQGASNSNLIIVEGA